MMQTTRYNSIRRHPVRFTASGPSAAAGRHRILILMPHPRDLDRSSTHATLVDVEPAHVTLSGDLSGDYVVEDHRPDGRVLLRPDLSVKAMLARHGERRLTPEEFEQHFGQLPTDGEG
jgi:hypothetical protein